MKTIPQIIKQLQENAHLPIIGMNVLGLEKNPTTVTELISYISELENVYGIEFSLTTSDFITSQYRTPATKKIVSQYAKGISILLRVDYLSKKEAEHPIVLVKIARNLKALNESNFERSDDHSVFKFWSDLKSKISKAMSNLTESEKSIVAKLTA